MKSRSSFTLIELIITISIIGILAATVIIIVNPAQLLEQGRDGRRISDLNSLNQAMAIYIYQGPGLSGLGSSDTVYVSLPDTTSTCSDLSLPALPSGWSYHCVTEQNLFKVDGTGWVPVNLNQITGGSPISVLPVDPVNSLSNGEYYTYAVSTSSAYEFTAYFESNKYQSTAASDGGPDPTAYELGSGLSVTPFLHGLISYWKFDDASGGLNSSTIDSSMWNNTAILGDSSSGSGPSYQNSGCVSDGCLNFDGADDYVKSNTANGVGNSTISECTWTSFSNFNSENQLGYIENTSGGRYFYLSTWCSSGSPYSCLHINNGSQGEDSGRVLTSGSWDFICGVIDMKNGIISTYINGNVWQSTSISAGSFSGTPASIWTGGTAEGYQHMAGLIDSVRFYNSALTSAQIQAMYNAEKTQL